MVLGRQRARPAFNHDKALAASVQRTANQTSRRAAPREVLRNPESSTEDCQ